MGQIIDQSLKLESNRVSTDQTWLSQKTSEQLALNYHQPYFKPIETIWPKVKISYVGRGHCT